MGALVHAAIFGPVKLQLCVGCAGNAAAVHVQRAHQRAGAGPCAEAIAAIAAICRILLHGLGHAAVNLIKARAGEPQRQRGHGGHGSNAAANGNQPFLARRAMCLPRRCACTKCHQHQQEGCGHAVFPFAGHGFFCLSLGAAAFFARFVGALGHSLTRCQLFPLDPVAFNLVNIGQAAARQRVDRRIDAIGFQKGDKFAIGYRKIKFRVRSVRIRAETVDPQHPAAAIQQWPAGIAARDRGSVQDGVKLPRWSRA